MSEETETVETTTSEYRVILGIEGGFDLFDLQTSTPVLVTANPDEDDDADIQETIDAIWPGNRLTATLEPTGEVRDTGVFESPVYRFQSVEIVDQTRSYHGFGDLPVVGVAEDIVTNLTKQGAGVGRATINDGEMAIGRVVVFNRDHPSPAEPIFEEELQSLREFGEPPFHVFQTATDDGRFFVHYYLVNTECNLGQAFLSQFEE